MSTKTHRCRIIVLSVALMVSLLASSIGPASSTQAQTQPIDAQLLAALEGRATEPQILSTDPLPDQAPPPQGTATGVMESFSASNNTLGTPSSEGVAAPADPLPGEPRRLILSPQSGAPGSSVALNGQGYAPNEPLRIFWGSQDVTGRRLLRADETGAFAASFDIPATAAPGAQTIAVLEERPAGLAYASIQRGISGSSASFTVVGEPAPLSPSVLTTAPTTAESEQPTIQQSRKAWTVILYASADSRVVNNITADLAELARGGGTSDAINVVAFVDALNQPTKYYEVRAGGPTDGPDRYLVDRTPTALTDTNQDSGTPKSFIDFMTFVAANYPADRYALSLWSHGEGWKGVQQDDVSNSYWNMNELRDALQGGLQQLNRPRFDLLFFDACYMAQYEVMLEIDGLASVVIASGERVPDTGMPYTDILQQISANPTLSNDELGVRAVASYKTYYDNPQRREPYTVSALKLGDSFQTFGNTLSTFSRSLLSITRSQSGDILISRRSAVEFTDREFIDLGSFAEQLTTNTIISDGVKADATQLLASLKVGAGFVLAEAHGNSNRLIGSTGLSIWLPEESGKRRIKRPRLLQEAEPVYEDLRVGQTPWFSFQLGLNGIFADDPVQQPPPVEEPAPPPASASPAEIVFSVVKSPSRIALSRVGAPNTRPANGQFETPLVLRDNDLINYYPRWSPSFTQVVFVANSSGSGATSRSGLTLDLFLMDANGQGTLRQLTQNLQNENCPNGPGTRTSACTVSQAFDPAWLSDGSGILYTLTTFDLRNYPNYTIKQTIRLFGFNTGDLEVLPRLLGTSYNNVRFTNADLRVSGSRLFYLFFSYLLPQSEASKFNNPSFIYNNIGLLDFTGVDGSDSSKGLTSSDFYFFPLNRPENFDPSKAEGGNYLRTTYPTLRPGRDEIVFFYNRIGDPPVMRRIDPRPAPAKFVPERRADKDPATGEPLYEVYDIARIIVRPNTTSKTFNYFLSIVQTWQTIEVEGVKRIRGVNYRPSWKPDGSSLTASFSRDGGFTYDVALLNNIAEEGGPAESFLITDNGASIMPSWGDRSKLRVVPRVVVSPALVEQGPNAAYWATGSGFQPGERVSVLQDGREVGTTIANEKGEASLRVPLPEQTLSVQSRIRMTGASSGATSNDGVVTFIDRDTTTLRVFVALLGR